MPILKNALKKQRADRRRTERNKLVRSGARSLVKKVRETRVAEDLKMTFSAVDRAAKRGVFHKKKADRIKSRLSKLIGKEPVKVIKKAKKKRKVAKKK